MEKSLTIHEFKYFYSTDLLKVPEYCFENKIEQGAMKPKDEAALTDYLAAKEEEIEKRRAEDEAAAQAAAAGAGGAKKADPKKDAKGAAKGGAKGAVGEDKNAPQPITVEYPEIESDKNYIIYERQFDAQPSSGAATRKPPQSARPLVGKASSKDAWGDMSEKFKDRSKDLISTYKITRGSTHSLAVKFRLNLEEERDPEPEAVEEPVAADPKKKK
jgi:hypothetical protein